MKDKLISLIISVVLVITVGFKVVSYADSTSIGMVEVYRLNIRSGPGNTYPVLWTVKQGDTLEVVGKEGSWLKIIFNNSYAYVYSEYVSSIYDNTVTEGVVANCSFLNVRSGPGKGYALTGCLVMGDRVQIVDHLDGWYKIIYNGSYAYVSSNYIVTASSGDSNSGSNTNNGNGSEKDNNDANSNNGNGSGNDSNDGSSNGGNGSENDSNDGNSIKTGYVVNCSFLNVRNQADNTSRIIDVLEKGEKVQIVDEAGQWYKILYKNEYAFVSKNYVVLNGSQTGGSESSGSQTVLDLNNFLFVGDSFTKRISPTIQNNTKNSYVRAASGAFPSDWINNFDQMPSASNVKGVSLLIGINGVTRESNLTDTKKLIDMLSQKYSGKMVFVQRVFPVGKGYNGYSDQQVVNYNNKIDYFNSNIKSYCATKSNVKFIDTTSGFVDSNGYLINCTEDGLHIAWDFNNKYFSNIKQAIIEAY